MRISDWSSDVCSSDLDDPDRPRARRREPPGPADPLLRLRAGLLLRLLLPHRPRHPPPRAPLAGEAVTPHRPSPLLYLSCSAPEPSIPGDRSVACPAPSGQARGRQPKNCLACDLSHDLPPHLDSHPPEQPPPHP